MVRRGSRRVVQWELVVVRRGGGVAVGRVRAVGAGVVVRNAGGGVMAVVGVGTAGVEGRRRRRGLCSAGVVGAGARGVGVVPAVGRVRVIVGGRRLTCSGVGRTRRGARVHTAADRGEDWACGWGWRREGCGVGGCGEGEAEGEEESSGMHLCCFFVAGCRDCVAGGKLSGNKFLGGIEGAESSRMWSLVRRWVEGGVRKRVYKGRKKTMLGLLFWLARWQTITLLR